MYWRAAVSVLIAVPLMAGCGEGAPLPAAPEAFVMPVHARAPAAAAKNFGTHLDGAAEVPSNDSRAQGQAIFQLNATGDALRYRLIVANIENVRQAHIHLGPSDDTGPIVVWLYPSAPPQQLIPGRSQGVLAEGVITDDDVVGLLAGTGLAGLLEQVRAGNTYVNVHTSQFPPGEIRGQLD